MAQHWKVTKVSTVFTNNIYEATYRNNHGQQILVLIPESRLFEKNPKKKLKRPKKDNAMLVAIKSALDKYTP